MNAAADRAREFFDGVRMVTNQVYVAFIAAPGGTWHRPRVEQSEPRCGGECGSARSTPSRDAILIALPSTLPVLGVFPGPAADQSWRRCLNRRKSMSETRARHASRRASTDDAQVFLGVLRHDHARLSRVMREMESQAGRLGTDPAEALPVLRDALRYMETYQYHWHHPREDLLFRRVAKRHPELTAEIDAITAEHEAGREHTQRIVARCGSERTAGRSRATRERLGRDLRDYVQSMRRHIRREEQLIYSAAFEGLDPAAWRGLVSVLDQSDPMGDADAAAREFPALWAELNTADKRVLEHPPEADNGAAHLKEIHAALLDSASAVVNVSVQGITETVRYTWRNGADILSTLTSPSELCSTVRTAGHDGATLATQLGAAWMTVLRSSQEEIWDAIGGALRDWTPRWLSMGREKR